MKISIIAAIDSKRGLGKDNQLLFKIKEDFIRMKKLTNGHPIVMGRKTFESISRPLPNRTNIVITHDQGYESEGIKVVHSLQEAIKLAKDIEQERLSLRGVENDEAISNGDRHASLAMTNKESEVFIFGGGQIFTEALPIVDTLYLTVVDGDYGADTFLPDYSMFTKTVFEQEGQEGEYHYKFLDLEK